MEKLKPCPFCGHKAEIHKTFAESGLPSRFFAACCVCGVETPRIARTWQEAEQAWNRRTAPKNKPLTIDQLHQMDGELVWVVTKDKCYRRTVTHSDSGMLHLCDLDGWLSTLNESNHGRDWEAYAEQPKEKPPTDGHL